MTPTEKCSTGIHGLDDILGGGLRRNRMYLLEGSPGAGKTTTALQLLQEGVRRGEKVLYVTLSETKGELEEVARSHGWNLEKLDIVDLSAVESISKTENTLFHPSEVELNNLARLLLDKMHQVRPSLMVLDSLSEMRMMAQSPLRYRRQILSFKQQFSAANCTVLLLDDKISLTDDNQVQSIVHGIITLTSAPMRYGVLRRYLTVTKLRGVRYREGNHDYVIQTGGLRVFPRLVASEHISKFSKQPQSSGNDELDKLLGGGFDSGTSNLLMGPAGSGKSTIASMFAFAAAERGDHVLYYAFDENAATLLQRTIEMGISFEPHVQSGRIRVEQIDPAEIAPGELAHRILSSVEVDKTRVVILDSLNGYVTAMPDEDYLTLHLHELTSYLSHKGAMTIMVMAQHGLVASNMSAPVDVSYLADTVVLLRFFEALGAVRKAISVIKKRSGSHETTIRELKMTEKGIVLGQPLTEFEGVLSGTPKFKGSSDKIIGIDKKST
ncbi:MAG TPA: ATPase domain-containing protein [Planctomycetota bacterium]|nr:ATPase domain-containing protein [Planctomycetota bacterium]